jgi:hypothetical protein
MKKRVVFLAVICSAVLVLASCATLDHGPYKVDTVPAADRVLLSFEGWIRVASFDGEPVPWTAPFASPHRATVAPGKHTLAVFYDAPFAGKARSERPISIECTFAPGARYVLYAESKNSFVHVGLREEKR